MAKRLIASPTVDIALRSLNANNFKRVQTWFDHLKNWENDGFVRSRSHQLEEVPGVYMLKTNSDLRIFFKIEANTITVLDVATKSTIMASSQTAAANE